MLELDPGELRHRVTLQIRSVTADSLGQQSTAWSTVATLWSSINQLSGGELLAAQEVRAEATHAVRMRFDARVVPQARLLFGVRVFNILSVANFEERNRVLDLVCQEGMNQG